MIVVTGHVAGVALRDLAGRAAERVPDAGPPTVLVCRTLDLVAGGRRSPNEVAGERCIGHGVIVAASASVSCCSHSVSAMDPAILSGVGGEHQNSRGPARLPFVSKCRSGFVPL